MSRYLLSVLLLLFPIVYASGEEPSGVATEDAMAEDGIEERDPDAPRLMSGMSILGNEEAPKSLVIVPWKASELGADLSLSDTLDDRARPVDKEVFLRELRFYEIRAEESQ
ncbi:MAG: hypothetical protein RLN69_10985 [Woeseiaceae bacterium]